MVKNDVHSKKYSLNLWESQNFLVKETSAFKLPLQIQIAIWGYFMKEPETGTGTLKKRAGKENEVRGKMSQVRKVFLFLIYSWRTKKSSCRGP